MGDEAPFYGVTPDPKENVVPLHRDASKREAELTRELDHTKGKLAGAEDYVATLERRLGELEGTDDERRFDRLSRWLDKATRDPSLPVEQEVAFRRVETAIERMPGHGASPDLWDAWFSRAWLPTGRSE